MKNRIKIHHEEIRLTVTGSSGRKDAENLPKGHSIPIICVVCGALFASGRWSWDDIPEEVVHGKCPACQRISDNDPAGIIEINGPFFRGNKSEVLDVVTIVKNVELSKDPLNRIIQTIDEGDKTILTTTSVKLAQCIGDTLRETFDGELSIAYKDDGLLKIHWNC